jgi:hypothetical protein
VAVFLLSFYLVTVTMKILCSVGSSSSSESEPRVHIYYLKKSDTRLNQTTAAIISSISVLLAAANRKELFMYCDYLTYIYRISCFPK